MAPSPVEAVCTNDMALTTRLRAPHPLHVLEAGCACTTPALLLPWVQGPWAALNSPKRPSPRRPETVSRALAELCLA